MMMRVLTAVTAGWVLAQACALAQDGDNYRDYRQAWLDGALQSAGVLALEAYEADLSQNQVWTSDMGQKAFVIALYAQAANRNALVGYYFYVASRVNEICPGSLSEAQAKTAEAFKRTPGEEVDTDYLFLSSPYFVEADPQCQNGQGQFEPLLTPAYQTVSHKDFALMHYITRPRSNDQRVQTIVYEYPDQSLSPYFAPLHADMRATNNNQVLALYTPCLRYGADVVRETLACLPGFERSRGAGE